MRHFFLPFVLLASCFGQIGPAGANPNSDVVWVNRPKADALPVGVSHHTYFSQSMKHEVGYLIYLPPDYLEAGVRQDPDHRRGEERHGPPPATRWWRHRLTGTIT